MGVLLKDEGGKVHGSWDRLGRKARWGGWGRAWPGKWGKVYPLKEGRER